jgi:hypothetical protein
MTGVEFTVGEVVEASRFVRGPGQVWEQTETARRFVVHGISAAGWLYCHPEGQPNARWNDYIVDVRDARRPAPGELLAEYGS